MNSASKAMLLDRRASVTESNNKVPLNLHTSCFITSSDIIDCGDMRSEEPIAGRQALLNEANGSPEVIALKEPLQRNCPCRSRT